MDHATFCWNELMTDNVAKAKAFYSETLGWTYEEMPMPDGKTYTVAMIDDEAVGGIMDMTGITPPGVPPHWFSYLEVDDVDKRIAGVPSAGGQVLRQPFDVEGIGRIAIVSDATGAAMGWMTSAEYDDEDDD